MNEMYVEKDEKRLRCGFTTGSCAAAASKAALIMLITGEDIHNVRIVTPKGIAYDAEIVDIERDMKGMSYDAEVVDIEKGSMGGSVSCAVIKDGGDDPDVTTGSGIYARVRFTKEPGIHIYGGEGVGRITKPGLDQPIGEAAINSVPRRMITENITAVLDEYGKSDRGVAVTISVPGGEETAKKTFNPKLGITGGISILGTTGIVEPMSDEAIIQTIRTEVRVRRAEGKKLLMVAPGNYGLSFLSGVYGIDESDVVLSSNFIYDTVRIAAYEGFEKLLFAGHIGKLVKVAVGIRNTHSRYGDHRMEILTKLSEECLSATAFLSVKNELQECVMTDEAVRIISGTGQGDKIFEKMADDIKANMECWSEGKTEVEVIVFANDNCELVATKRAHDFLEELL